MRKDIFFSGSKKQKEFLHSVLGVGMDFLSGDLRRGKVIHFKSNEEFLKEMQDLLPRGGVTSFKKIVEDLKNIGKFSISQADPGYIAFPDSGNAMAGLAGDIFLKFLNQNLIAVDRSAPLATFIEMQVIEWLRELVGFETKKIAQFSSLNDVGGMWTTGGHMSNHMAILTALNEKFPEVKRKGLTSLKKSPKIVLAEKIGHYSYASAMHHLGLGQENIISCGANTDYTTDVEDLERVLKEHALDGDIFMVVAVSGNSRTTSLDDVRKIAKVCKKYGVWMHVDACHGGALLFSDKLKKQYLAGIEQADSVAIDPHKGMFLTYPSSFILFKKRGILTRYSRYEAKVKDGSSWDLGFITPFFGSKPFESLKVWMMLKYVGKKELSDAVEQREKNANFVWKKLDKSEYFCMLHDNTFYRMCFVFLPKEIAKKIQKVTLDDAQKKSMRNLIEEYTHKINQELYEEGNVCLDEFKLQDIGNVLCLDATEEKMLIMSVTIGNPIHTEKTLSRALGHVFKKGEKYKEDFINKARSILNGAKIKRVKQKLSGPAGWN